MSNLFDNIDENVEILDFSRCKLTEIPDLSRFKNLKKLDLSFNNIKTVNNLPNGLEYLDMTYNLIKYIDNLPITLYGLNVSCNPIKNFDMLPITLYEFEWHSIKIDNKNFYNLPPNLRILKLFDNHLNKNLPIFLNEFHDYYRITFY